MTHGSPHAPHFVKIVIDGVPLIVPAHTSVAAALLNRKQLDLSQESSAWEVRQSVTGSPRGPLCGMGICFECRATVDGQSHVRTCQMQVRDGMEVRTYG